MKNIIYDPKGFSDFYETNLGKRVWEYLQTELIFELMRLATDFNRPAAEGIGDKLIEKFGNEIDNDKNNRIKQAIGHMIRAIMESHNYQHVKSSVPCSRKNELFKNASRYSKIE
ncbi:hypothetical protein [Polaribacter sp. M15]